MCGRYYIPEGNEFSDIDELLRQIKTVYKDSPILPQLKLGEIFPTDIVPVLTPEAPKLMKWGFDGFGGKGIVINARAETVSEKPMFRKEFLSSRCLLPASCYFEWKKEGAKKTKYSIRLNEPIYMAGLYHIDEKTQLPQFVILTRTASSQLKFIHERMPVILSDDLRGKWLDCKISAQEMLELPTGNFAFESVG